MFKKYIMAGLALMASVSAVFAQNYKIVGTTQHIDDGSKVYLRTFGGGTEVLDSAIVKNGKFEITHAYDKVSAENELILSCVKSQKDRIWTSVLLFVENGGTTNVTMDMDGESINNTVSGGLLNEKLNAYNTERNDAFKAARAIREQLKDSTLTAEQRRALEKKSEDLYDNVTKVEEKHTLQNLDNLFGMCLINNCSALFSNETKQKIIAQVPECNKNNPAVVELRNRAETEAKTAEGKHYIDLSMPDPQGKIVRLSDYVSKNKLTLIDFWASWCGPCRKEIPSVRKLYADYKAKGVGVVGVSFDSKKESWIKAIKDLMLEYPQMSDLKGWDCAASPAYNIQAIPFTLLVAQDGTIVGRNLHDGELIKRIEEYLNK